MFTESIDNRLSDWVSHRRELDSSENPLQDVWDFWSHAPFIPYNKKIDPYFQKNWPTPWEIIVDNKYDDFTKALMIGWTLKLTKKFRDSKIEIKTLVDVDTPREYNVVCIDDEWALNFDDNGPILMKTISSHFRLENLIEVNAPR